MRWLCIVLCFGLTFCDNITNDEPPEIDYYSMPALSELDDFDLCLREPESVYCIVDFVLMEDDSPLYQYIKVDTMSVRYCKTQGDYIPVDTLDYIIGSIILLVLFLNLGCSTHYFFWPPQTKQVNQYMLAFCIQKNWKALKYGGSAEGGIFKCFQALRYAKIGLE
ncbi:unnamed protein product [Diatraea saccharalis]|uniref:Uncharacterized protein n=1 Tax=Diatraea saccharalis TaxID=40085 RepID=A0A9N9R879_9NEOP|nr:unnamed protein product [Diatraea saccharalis]